MTKHCENCGKPFEPEQSFHKYCSPACHREAQAKAGGTPSQQRAYSGTRTSFRLDDRYLADGYFTTETGKRILRPEVVDALAQDVAKVLGSAGMNSHQLRRFFNKMRAIEAKLASATFDEVRADILGFKRDVACQVGRNLVSEDFKRFIDRNVELAIQDEEDFRKGFIQHFQSVLCYFVYYFRDK